MEVIGEISEDAMDRISELPAFIVHQIMSHLSAKEVAQTSILSKTWNGLHASFPILDFDQTYFVGECCRTNQKFFLTKYEERFCRGMGKFMEFVDVSLLRFCLLNLCIQKFRLLVTLLDVNKLSSLVDKWIRLAVTNGVKEIDLEVITDEIGDVVYTLPQTIFSAEVVTTLKLSGCKLEQPSESIKLHSLKKLTLHSVFINEQMVQKLVSTCPLLEELSFSCCQRLKRLCVSEAPKLKSMIIESEYDDELESLQIVVPSLHQFTLKLIHKWPLVIDLAGCPHLKMLNLTGVNFTDQEFHQFVSQFPLLEELFVYWCRMLKRITISSTQLKTLEFHCYRNLEKLDVDTPNLLSFVFHDNKLPSTFSIRAPCTWKVFFRAKFSEFNSEWCLKLRELLGAANKIEDLVIYVEEKISLFNYTDQFKESCRFLPCHVERLHLHIDHVPASDYKILLDGLLCFCYPRTFSVTIVDTFSKPGTLKNLQNKLFKRLCNEMKNRDVNCCNYSHIKCWRHYLKDIEIESFLRFDDGKLFDRDDLMKLLNIDNLMEIDAWYNLPEGVLHFQLDWC